MTLLESTLAALAVTASFSRLLTLLALWQRKEWRWDRLQEHFASEGIANQLYGRVEPLIMLAGAIVAVGWRPDIAAMGTLIAINVMGIAKSALRRQPMPVWTQKTIVIASAVILLLIGWAFGIAYLALPTGLFTVFPLLSPIALTLAWVLALPLDIVLKRRIMHAARKIRTAREDLVAIGITGSVGKTTTKELIAHVLTERQPLVTPAHVNSDMGVANWMRATLPKHPEATLLIVEMGAYRHGEISVLCDMTRPQYGVITFIGDAHLGLFGSREAIAQAKGELFASLPESGAAFLNADSPFAQDVAARCHCPVVTVSTGSGATLIAHDIEELPTGIRCTVEGTTMTIPLRGTHNVTNVLLAIGVARTLGMDLQKISERLITFTPPHHTFEREERNGATLLNDTYNCSPESFKAAIAWARTQPQEKKVLVTSGILELGENSARIHGDVGAMAKDVFHEVYFVNATNADAFGIGYGKTPPLLNEQRPTLAAGDLLVCVGRMPQTLIDSLLPQ